MAISFTESTGSLPTQNWLGPRLTSMVYNVANQMGQGLYWGLLASEDLVCNRHGTKQMTET